MEVFNLIQATKIRMKSGREASGSLTEIESIYLEGSGIKENGYYSKESVHDFIVKNPTSPIKVNIYPYPELIPATSSNNEKYVRSKANNTPDDNLLKLPR